MPGRNGQSQDYRYGFQGQETDNEFTGSESHVGWTYRCSDSRIGRFLSTDPLAPKYPYNSPYAFSENRLIDGVEFEGLETTLTKTIKKDGSVEIKIKTHYYIIDQTGKGLGISELQAIGDMIAHQIEVDYTLFDPKTNTNYITEVEVTVSESQLHPDYDYFIAVVDVTTDAEGRPIYELANEGIAGKVDKIGDTKTNRLQVRYDPSGTTVPIESWLRTASHEHGHGLGLRHPRGADPASDPNSVVQASESPENLMRQSRHTKGHVLRVEQLQKIVEIVTLNGGATIINENKAGDLLDAAQSSAIHGSSAL